MGSEEREITIKPAEPGKRNGTWLKMLLLVAFLCGTVALLYATGWVQFFLDKERMTQFIQSLGPWGFAGFILLQAAQVVAAPIPGELTGVLGGFLFGPLLGILLSTVGLTLGSLAAFLLSKTFGRPLVDRFVDEKVIHRFDFLLHRKGAFLVFLLFLFPGFPKDYLCYLLGLGHLTIPEFVLISATGRLAGTAMLTFGGAFLREGKYVELSLLGGFAVLVVIVAMAYRDKLGRRRE